VSLDRLQLVDGAVLTVRPIEAEDAERLRRMFFRLSPTTIYKRFFSPIQHPSRALLERLTSVDHDQREALVALDGDEIVAVARYDGEPGTHSAEIAVTVEDEWQHRGVGRKLARRLALVAMDHGFDEFSAIVLPDNRDALGLLRSLSPDAHIEFDSSGLSATLPLRRAG
jgi:ribosomal protein S18 acetylase RimI-like enzyme